VASHALARLAERDLITYEDTVIVAGRPRHVRLLHANRLHPAYRTLAPILARVTPPETESDEEVPARLRHLFWNTTPTQFNLKAAHWRAAAQARGLDPAVRAMAENLAAGGEG
jgi:hypothetical protein